MILSFSYKKQENIKQRLFNNTWDPWMLLLLLVACSATKSIWLLFKILKFKVFLKNYFCSLTMC